MTEVCSCCKSPSAEVGHGRRYCHWNSHEAKAGWMEKSAIFTYDLYGPVRNAFVAGNIHYEGKWEEVGPWKSRLFWAL
jgi:hypothetical protein